MIEYYVSPNPSSHLFEIRMIIKEPDPSGQILTMPTWIPGSYFIRDYARHIVTLEAFTESARLKLTKINSNTWQCEKTAETLHLIYQVYAYDPSVRGAHLDTQHGFFNGCCLFLMAKGKEALESRVYLASPTMAKNWTVATTLPRFDAPLRGFGWYTAPNYEALIDYPVEMGTIAYHDFEIAGVTHTVAITGKYDANFGFVEDLKKICLVHQQLFQEPLPFDHYLFLLKLVKEGYGGLEHRNSTALIASRNTLSSRSIEEKSSAYLSTLSLFSHEYFHAWLVKRIKPACFINTNLDNKVYTNQLWAFEGITSYYDTLALVRGKVISVEQYLQILSEYFTKLLRNPGRRKQSLVDSSFDAWTKFYQPNENSVNSLVSYYTKGSFVALTIDLALRLETQGRHSLDTVMITLWQNFGKTNIGVPEGKIEEMIIELGGLRLKSLLESALFEKEDLPLADLLASFGVNLQLRAATSLEDKGGALTAKANIGGYLGCNFNKGNNLIVVNVMNDSPAEKAGLCAFDEIIAIDDVKIDMISFSEIMRTWQPGQKIKLHLFRLDELISVEVILSEAPLDTACLSLIENPTREQKENLEQWLNLA